MGGSVAEFYVIDSAKSDVRQTMDVDCFTHFKSYRELTSLEERLRSCGFQNDTTPGAPICRWVYDNEIVDIMPDEIPVYDETLLNEIGKNFKTDTVITHTAPSFCELIAKEAYQSGQNGMTISLLTLTRSARHRCSRKSSRGCSKQGRKRTGRKRKHINHHKRS